MDIMIVGSNARTGSSRYADTYLTMSGIIRDVLRSAGHTANIVEWWDEPISADLVLVGIASPLTVSSSRAYAPLRLVSRLWGDPRLRLFIDDPETRVIQNALTSAARDPYKVVSSYLSKRYHFAEVREGGDAWEEMVDGLVMLNDVTDPSYPVLHIPAYPWANTDDLMREQSWGCVPVSGIDLTPALLDGTFLQALQEPSRLVSERDDWYPETYWIAESLIADTGPEWKAVLSHGVVAPVLEKKSRTKGYQRVMAYRRPGVIGVMENRASIYGGGWWTPVMGLAANLDVYYYSTDSKTLSRMVEPSGYLQHVPGAYEELDSVERLKSVERQTASLAASVGRKDDIIHALLGEGGLS